jgi:hypothetical protein
MLSWNIFKDIIILSNFVYKRKHINICHCITEVWAKLLSFYTLKYFIGCMRTLLTKRVWRHQRGNQNPFIKEELTTQWPKENVQKDKQRSTKHTDKTKDRITRAQLKTGGELRCSGMVSSSCSKLKYNISKKKDRNYLLSLK